MRISRLVLSGYKRLTIRGVNRFSYYPGHPHQLIIGTNGSGKSSVLAELSPRPITPSAYHKDGYKEIEIHHRNSNYVLKSTVVGSHAKHSFLKDDIELNDGGTGAVQKILVEQEFSITQELLDVLTGKVRFTSMSAPARRSWIMRLSGDNLDYAMRVYQDVRTKHRDTQAVLKHTQKRLAEESKRLADDLNVDQLAASTQQLKEEITVLMGEVDKPKQRSDAILTNLQLTKTKLVSACEAYIVFKQNQITWHGCDHDSVIATKAQLLHRQKDKLPDLYAKIRKLEDIIATIEGGNYQSTEATKCEIDRLLHRIEGYYATMNFDHREVRDIARYTSAYYGIHQTLVELFTVFLDNSNRHFTREARDQTRSKIDELKIETGKLRRVIGDAEHRLEHISNQKDIQCPKCDHHWKPGLFHGEVSTLQNTLLAAQAKYAACEQDLKHAEHFLENILLYSSQWGQWSSIMANNPRYSVLWTKVTDLLHAGHSPKNCILQFDEWAKDCKTLDLIADMHEKLNEQRNIMSRVEEVGYATKTQYENLLQHHHGEVEECLTEIAALEEDIEALRVSKALTHQLNHLTKEIVEQHDLLNNQFHEYAMAVRTEMLKEDIYGKQSILAHEEHQLAQFNAVHSVVKDLKNTEETVSDDLHAYGLLMSELSPVDGLIAEQLKGFVSAFVGEINLVLSAIWTHDFVVHPCGQESGELDYKFPITCHGADIKIADVAHGSSSQVDVVDFAFRLVVMRMLGLNDYPLYLDELAPSLDEQHRINIMSFVKQFVEMGRCSQMFMISHYDSSHFTFAGAEVCVMDSANILNMPDVYNQHVEFG